MGIKNHARQNSVHQSYPCLSTTTIRYSHSEFQDYPHPYPLFPIRPVLSSLVPRLILDSALAYDWSKGHSGAAAQGQPNGSKIMLHPVKPEEVQKKKK